MKTFWAVGLGGLMLAAIFVATNPTSGRSQTAPASTASPQAKTDPALAIARYIRGLEVQAGQVTGLQAFATSVYSSACEKHGGLIPDLDKAIVRDHAPAAFPAAVSCQDGSTHRVTGIVVH